MYTRLARSALGRPVASVATPDPWFIKGEGGGEAVASALLGHQLVAARRLGKVTLLDIDSGATLGIRFGMTGTLVVDGRSAVDGLMYAPRRHDPRWDRFTVGFEDGGSLVVSDPRR